MREDGIEAAFQTNHLGHFLLERLLHDRLLKDRTLVVFTRSVAVHRGRVRTGTPVLRHVAAATGRGLAKRVRDRSEQLAGV